MNENPSEIIEKYAEKLPFHEHIKLIERLERQLIKKSGSIQQQLDWKELYGLGKGLRDKEDAQDYVNRLRESRI